MLTKKSAEIRRQQKQFEKERRTLQRALPKAIKMAAGKSGWRTAQGTLFREMDGWFFDAKAIPWITEAKTSAALRCKPMSLDPLFWQLVGMEENINTPLSFRSFGAFTCRTPALREIDIPEGDGSPEFIAKELVDWANEQLQLLRGTQTIDGFVDFIRTHPNYVERRAHLAVLVTGMLLQGRDEEALAICKDAKARAGGSFLNENGGFMFRRGDEMITFIDLAIEWITAKRDSRVIN